jgi:hypothetical protein
VSTRADSTAISMAAVERVERIPENTVRRLVDDGDVRWLQHILLENRRPAHRGAILRPRVGGDFAPTDLPSSQLIGATTTKTGFKVEHGLSIGVTTRRASNQQKPECLDITGDLFHLKWNNTLGRARGNHSSYCSESPKA